MQTSIIMLSKPKYTTDVGCCKLISSVRNCDMCQLCYNVIITEVHKSMCRQEAHMFLRKNMIPTCPWHDVSNGLPPRCQYQSSICIPHYINNCRYTRLMYIHTCAACVCTFPFSFSLRNEMMERGGYTWCLYM